MLGDVDTMRVATINDLSGFGKCSLMADIGVLSAMGIEVCPVPTAVLSAQTGFPEHHLLDTSSLIDKCKEDWLKMGARFDSIITGYIPQERDADDIISFVKAFKVDGTSLLVDPVMGDGGRFYSNYSDGMLGKIKFLATTADIITPNLTELCILAGFDAGKAKELEAIADQDQMIQEVIGIAEKVRTSKAQNIVVTGIHKGDHELCNLVVSGDGNEVVECKTNGKSYSGTGDLFAATLLGYILKGKNTIDAVKLTTEFISSAIEATGDKDRNYGVDFEKVLGYLSGGDYYEQNLQRH